MRDELVAERRRFAGLVTVACLALTLPRLLLHELWRDEAWLWLVVRESRSLGDLFSSLARSGQGYLFPLLCFLARQVSTSPRALQLLHLALVGVATFAFVRWAPFNRRERALFALGYFPFYEYAVISRHYVVGALLVWLACTATRGRRPALALGALLGLLCQTTVYGFILAVALAGGWLLDRRLRRREVAPLSRPEAAVGLALGLTGAVAGLVQLVPQAGTSFAPAWRFGWNPALVLEVLKMPWHAFVPLPRPELHFWNTSLFDAWPDLQVVGGLLTLALAVVVLWPRKPALATFCLGSAGILAFGYIKLVGELRHQGHLWLLFAAALWLAGESSVRDRRSWRSRIFLILLLVHCIAGAYASWMDIRHPFSNGPATAALLRATGLDREPLLGHREPPAAAVALPLGRPLFAPSRGVFATRPDWGPAQREMADPELRCVARQLARRAGRDVVLVINRALPAWAETEPLGERVGAIVSSEDFHLYRLRRDRLAATAGEAGCGEASH